eukprot:TRINITY_DN19023_c0_g1_i1.p1 TRINITY_DN19023_c0_g1~~TRINITY_DN19023_c0_g1_i1.p1  ORF type:complete len:500 (+),score=117.36 TRINITY_DN19023_c0_g1_i1:69-1502(+)
MSALTDDGSSVIGREIDLVAIHRRGGRDSKKIKTTAEINDEYDVDGCISFIKSHEGAERVALQLPDENLGDATAVQGILREACPGILFFVMADTLFAPCCVDDITAQHTRTDLILKFGDSCLTKTVGVPVHYIPPYVPVSEETRAKIQQQIDEQSPDTTIIVTPSMKRFFPRDVQTNEPSDDCQLSVCGVIPSGNKLFIIGHTPGAALEAALWHEYKMIQESNPEVVFVNENGETTTIGEVSEYPIVTKRLRARNFLIEKIKDVEVITIVAISLNIKGYAEVIEKLKALTVAAGKQTVVVYVGKPNVPKLANYEETDLYCVVTCPQSTWFDTKEYPKPVVTPMEVAIALGDHVNGDDDWNPYLSPEYYTLSLQPVMSSFKNTSSMSPDTSLLTGAIRSIPQDWHPSQQQEPEGEEVEDDEAAMVTYQSKQISLFQETPLVSRLHARSYQGLERTEAPVQTEIAKGMHGVAAGYVPVK